MTVLPQHPEPGQPLQDHDELLYRNARIQLVQGGHPSSQVFEPSPSDGNLLSLDREALTNPREAFERFLASPGASSAGILGVSVGECHSCEVPALENALPDNPAHVVADFRVYNRSQAKKRAGRLRDAAIARGWVMGPKYAAT